MRRAVVLLLLLGLMSGVSALQAEASGTVDPLTLAAIGFVVLASFSAAELGVRLGLPRVTGYIVSGLVLGPSVLDILSRPVVQEMGMFKTLALGLIATAAGLELDIAQIRRVGRTLLATVAAKLLFAMVLVGGATWAMFSAFGMPDVQRDGAGPALALIFGALALGTSPAIVLAVLRDSRAAGRLSDLVLGAAVLKDVVVVITLAIAIAIASALLGGSGDGGSAGVGPDVLLHVAKEIGFSIVAGSLLGALLIAYIRWVHSEMLLFVSAMVLIVAQVAMALHLELLLVFITAGFVVRNFSHHEHDLAQPMEMVSLPVFIVFFTIAGADVDLARTLTILPLAIVLFGARVLAFWIAARVGGQFGGESAVIRDRAFLAYLPQAGVTLGLVGLAASRLPEIGDAIATTGTAVVALNLLIGPIALRAALGAAGELEAGPASAPEPIAGDDHGLLPTITVTEEPAAPVPEREALCQRICHEIEDLELAALLRRLATDLDHSIERLVDEHFATWAQGTSRSAAAALGSHDEGASLRRWALVPQGDLVLGHGGRVRTLFDELRARLRALPVELDLAFDAIALAPDHSDTMRCRLRKAKLRWMRRLGRPLPRRRVPLRLAARMVLEPRLARHAVLMLGAMARAQAAVFETLRGHAEGVLTADEARRDINRNMTLLVERVRGDARHMLAAGFDELAGTLRMVGGPRLPVSEVRFSRVESAVREALRDLAEHPAAWRDALAAAQHSLLLVVELAALRQATDAALERHLVAPAAEALGGVRQVIIGVRTGLQAVADACGEEVLTAERLTAWADAANASFAQKSHRAIETRLHAFRAGASIHRVAVELRSLLSGLPPIADALHPATPLSSAATPDDVVMRPLDLRVAATEALIHGLLSDVDERLDSTSRLLANTGPRLREAVDVALFAVESRVEVLEPTADDAGAVRAAFARAIARVDRLEAEIGATAEKFRGETHDAVGDAYDGLNALLHEHGVAPRAAVVDSALGSARRQIEELAEPVLTWWRREIGNVRDFVVGVRDSRLGAELRARTRAQRLDAAELRAHVDAWQKPAGIPDSYARLFALQPVREHRLFTAYRTELETLRATERAWLEGGPGSALIVGEHGSGRSSLLNMCELELTVPRVLRPNPVGSFREAGLDAALAIELGCRPQRRSVQKALRKVRTAVLLDDLERWLTPDEAGLRALSSLLDLIGRTRESVYWLATTNLASLRLLEEVMSVEPSFARVIRLRPLDHAELQQAIEARHALSGRDLVLPRSAGGRLLGRLLGARDGQVLYRVLARVSGGNLSRGMTAWLRAIEYLDEETVHPAVGRTLSLGLPPFAALDPTQVAILLAVLRFGGASPKQLADALGVPHPVAAQHTGFLRAAGLLEASEARRDEKRVPRALVGPVIQGLRDVGTEP